MVIIFYDNNQECVYVCTEKEKMKIISVDDPNLLSYVPNDNILYIKNADYITKQQLTKWLEGHPSNTSEIYENIENKEEVKEVSDKLNSFNKYTDSKWICPSHNGTIIISDIKTKKYPKGVELTGKYDFVAVESLGGFESLEKSLFFKTFLAKGKIKIVDYEYVKKNYGKKNRNKSLADAALDAILIPSDQSIESVVANGGIDRSNDDAIPFFVE